MPARATGVTDSTLLSRLRQIVESSLSAIAISDLSGTLTYVNASFLRMWRYDSASDVVGRPAPSFWESEAAAGAIIAHLLSKTEPWTGELVGIRRDGERFDAQLVATLLRDDAGQPSGLSASFLDVTAQKEHARRVAVLTRLYAFLSQVNATIVRATDVSALLQQVCEIAVTAGGFRMAWVGFSDPATNEVRPVCHAGHENGYLALKFDASIDAPEGRGPTGLAIREGKLVTTTDIASDPRMTPWRDAALTRGYRSSAGVPLRRNGSVVGQLSLYAADVGFFTPEEQQLLEEIGGDVSFALDSLAASAERERAESERVQLLHRLSEAERLESVGRLAGGVAHDFNNMLGVIMGFSELALSQLDADHPVREDLRQVYMAATRSAELTRQLLAFARRQPIAPRVLDLNEAVASALKLLRRLIGEELSLTLAAGETLWSVNIDPSQVDQLLTNLVVNARDAINGVGTITIRTANVTVAAGSPLAQTHSVSGEFVALSVSDTGTGIDEATMAHIFEPFFTTKPEGRGTGLGLATVYGIVRQNDGFIAVESAMERGTTVTVYLRRFSEPAVDLTDATEQTVPRGSETILVVEDEPSVLLLATRLLESQGYTVVTAGAPTEAMTIARRAEQVIDAAVLDVIMPEMNGAQLAQQLRVARAGLRCLFMSAYPASIVTNRGILETSAPYVQKPFTAVTLGTALRQLLDRA